MSIALTATTLCIIITGLMAGLYIGWLISVLPGLQQLNDQSYLQVFQSLNRAILNLPFKVLFVAAAVAVPLITVTNIWTQHLPAPTYWWIASALLLLGHAGVTILGNIPLNMVLDGLDLENLTPSEQALQRNAFELPWTRWHSVRTLACTIAFALLLLDQIQMGRVQG